MRPAVLRRGAACSAGDDEAVEHAPRFEEGEEVEEVDLRHHHAAPGKGRHQPLGGQPLKRFPERRAPDADVGAQFGFGEHPARRQLQRDDHRFDEVVRAVGEGGSVVGHADFVRVDFGPDVRPSRAPGAGGVSRACLR